jgi:hypothetical protein
LNCSGVPVVSAGHPLWEPAMNATGTITMTMRKMDRFKVIEAVMEIRLKVPHVELTFRTENEVD